MIPRIIHQNYMPGWDAVPADVKANIAALRERNPNWEYRFYDEATGRQLIADHLPELLADYDRLDPSYYAARSDFLRYCASFVHGGFYLDLKSVAKRPLDEVLRPDDHFVLSQWPDRLGKPSGHPELRHILGCEYVNFFIASSQANPILQALVLQVSQNIKRYRLQDGVGWRGVMRVTGPVAFSLVVEAVRGQHPHRIAHLENDLGIAYSFYGDTVAHRARFGRHYTELSRPVVRLNPLSLEMLAARYARLRGKVSRIPAKLRSLGR